MSSSQSKQLAKRIFFTCMMTTYIANLFNTTWLGWERYGLPFGYFDVDTSVMFPVKTKLTLHVMCTVPACILGIIGGLLGSLFTVLVSRVGELRRKYITTRTLKILEPCVLAFAFSALSLLLPLTMAGTCEPSENTDGTSPGEVLRTSYGCPRGFYNPLASITIVTPQDAMENLLSRDLDFELGYSAIFVAVCLYFPFAVLCSGTALSAGAFFPMLFFGGLFGRFFGHILLDAAIAAGVYLSHGALQWINPGVFALIGCASFVAGATRLTVSLTVIVLEISADVYFLAPVLITVLTAKLVGDKLTPPLYTMLIVKVKRMPLLPEDLPVTHFTGRMLGCFTAADAMTEPVITLNQHSKVLHILHILETTSHNGFPVVGVRGNGPGEGYPVFLGTILRRDLLLLLSHPPLLRRVGAVGPAPLLSVREIRAFWRDVLLKKRPDPEIILNANDQEFKKTNEETLVDLKPYTNTSAFTVNELVSLERSFALVRSMSVRHLTVVNVHNEVVGMLTRKDFIGAEIERRLRAKFGGDPSPHLLHRIDRAQGAAGGDPVLVDCHPQSEIQYPVRRYCLHDG